MPFARHPQQYSSCFVPFQVLRRLPALFTRAASNSASALALTEGFDLRLSRNGWFSGGDTSSAVTAKLGWSF
ncbi:MAG: hypothetical protein ACKOED_11395 [Aestuariivirga sp.]|uniref:hypothetical protein n=1 Tax=Aestuariivirga sp. TaxID=2650926 RepID=UPI0038D08467